MAFTITQHTKSIAVESIYARIGTLNANWFRCFPPGTLLCTGAKVCNIQKRMRVIWYYRLRSLKNWWFCFRYRAQIYKRVCWEQLGG